MNRLRYAAIAVVGLGLTVSLPANRSGVAAAPAPARSCFYVTQIGNSRAADARTLYLRVSGRSVYRVDMKYDCEGLRPTSEPIVLAPTPSGQICGPLDVDITVGEHGTHQRCVVGDIVKLTPEEAAALPRSVTP
jgi:hypothetical protein